ncbi:MAG: signal peptidase I [Candidatus Hodarchaeales archaeon]|jgi:signal peptidase I
MFYPRLTTREVVKRLFRKNTRKQWLIIKGASMSPALLEGQYILLDTDYHSVDPIHRGEIIAFESKNLPTKLLIKRVIGLPGETIEIQNQKVLITGVSLKETYVHYQSDSSFNYFAELKNEEYFVLGDNRQDSLDSRKIGKINISDIVGVARFRLWPPTKL